MGLNAGLGKKGIALLLAALLFWALAQGALAAKKQAEESPIQVRVYLAQPMETNVKYASAGKTYDRDWIKPQIAGTDGALYARTQRFNTYFYPLLARDGVAEARLFFPAEEPLVSAALNGHPLSFDEPVTVNLTDVADLRLASGKKCCGVKMMFTTLPVVSIQAEDTIVRSGTAATFFLADPEYLSHGWTEPSLTCQAVISRRGRSASLFGEKHPFNLSLMKDGKKWDRRLLGLRRDSDWLLDSAYNDSLRVRNRVLMDLWDEIYTLPWDQTLSGANRGSFVEVILNGRYKGIFALAEKQDRKQLGLKKNGNGLLLKTGKANTKDTSPAGFFSLGEELPGATEINKWHNVEIKYPKKENVTAETWTDFYELVRLVTEGSDEEFAEKIADYVDLKNAALYYVFMAAMDVTDNMRKNMVYARYDENTPFVMAPWDMDASLGRYYSSKKSKEKDLDSNPLFDRLIALDVDGFNKRVAGIWMTLKDSAFSVDYVMGKIEAHYAVFRQSGAAAREKELYSSFTSYLGPDYTYSLNFEKEISYVRTYMEKHLAFIDRQFQDPY